MNKVYTFWTLLAIFNLVGIALIGSAAAVFITSPVSAGLWGVLGGLIIVIIDAALLIKYANEVKDE